MRLIDADALMADIKRQCDEIKRNGSKVEALIAGIVEKGLKGEIDAAPTIEPKRKKGKWIDAVIPNDNGNLPSQVCDQCNTFFPLAYTGGGHNFCPNCGADMREEEQDE